MEENKNRAMAKLILLGEHSVVYGKPAISIPFPSLEVKTHIKRIEGPIYIRSDYYRGSLEDMPDKFSGPREIIVAILEDFGEEVKNLDISIDSRIPLERGMGSSAAVAISLTRALYGFFSKDLSKEDLRKWAHRSEKLVHGQPSGLDAATIIEEKPIYYVRDRLMEPMDINMSAYLVVVDSGMRGETKDSVAGVKEWARKYPKKFARSMEELELLAEKGRENLEHNRPGDLGRDMFLAHKILGGLGVSNESLDKLVDKAMENQALGAKLTGGGRGGSIIALAEDYEGASSLARILLEAGGQEAWILNMELI